jgi:membrane dipeptidase
MLIWDAHAGFELKTVNDLATLSIWKNAGVNFLSVDVGYDVNEWTSTVKAISLARKWLNKTNGFQLAGNVAEIDQANANGEMAIAFDIEGLNALNNSLDMVDFYYHLGVRQMLFAYNINNGAKGGCHDEDLGLTKFGRAVVEKMYALGMLIDCSHCGYRTTMEAMDCSTDPVVFSHSNAKMIRDHERNITGKRALRCAEIGGVIGVNGISIFVGDNDTTSSSITNHIECYLDLIGPEYVGIGLDYFHSADDVSNFTETVSINTNFWPVSEYPFRQLSCAIPTQINEIAEILLRRNHREMVVRRVIGGNFKRVAAQVWK